MELTLRISLWIVWAALLLGAFFFACVTGLFFSQPQHDPPAEPRTIAALMFVDIAFGVPVVALVHGARVILLRMLVKRGEWRGVAIAYPIAKFGCWAVCDGVVFFSLVICLIAFSFWPGLVVAVLAWLGIAADFPRMQPFDRLAQKVGASAA